MKIKEKIKSSLDEKFGGYAWYNSFKDDYGFRTLTSTVGGAAMNVIFACFNGVTALKYMSLWYGVFSGYYLTLAIMRICVLLAYFFSKKRSGGDESKLNRSKLKIYFFNGAVFVPLDIALGAVITVMITRGKPVATGEIMAITSATYTTYKTVMAIRHLFKAKSAHDFLVQTIRYISLIDALTSILSLETTLISTFGTLDYDMLTLMAVSGLAVCAFTVLLGSHMIIKGARELKINYKEKKNEGI